MRRSIARGVSKVTVGGIWGRIGIHDVRLDLERNMASPWPFTVQCHVARTAGDQGLPTIRDHAGVIV